MERFGLLLILALGDKANTDRTCCRESSAGAEIARCGTIVFDYAWIGAFSLTMDAIITWIFVIVIAAGAAILIAHAIDAIRS